jgi:hypothetical protein
MDRRTFIGTAGALACSGLAVAAPTCALATPALRQMSGRKVRLKGWLQPAGEGQSHFFTLTADRRAKPSRDLSVKDWNGDSVRVLPKDAKTFRAGPVWVEGVLQTGSFADAATGFATGAVLLDARLV